jgi:hypothetical protein
MNDSPMHDSLEEESVHVTGTYGVNRSKSVEVDLDGIPWDQEKEERQSMSESKDVRFHVPADIEDAKGTQKFSRDRKSSRSSVLLNLKEKTDKAGKLYASLFGDDYSRKEGTLILIAGALLSFNTGYVNGSCISGLITPGTPGTSIAGFTSKYSKSALFLAEGDLEKMGAQLALVAAYWFGSFLSGILTPRATPYRLEPTYIPSFLLAGTILLVASILAADGAPALLIFCFAAAAAGIQNGVATIFSSGLIRCSLTGSTTDIGIVVGQVIRGNYKKVAKGLVLAIIVINFWLGGLISYWGTKHFRTKSLYFNAGLFFSIGISLIVFLVNELEVSVIEAVFGTWQWKRKVKILTDGVKSYRMQLAEDDDDSTLQEESSERTLELEDLFDEIDLDGNGTLDENEVFVGLNQAGFKIDLKSVIRLMRLADKDTNGSIDRDEWITIARICSGMLSNGA